MSIAKAAGFSIEPSELLAASRGLTDKELECVAGGKDYGNTFICNFTENKDCKVFD